MNASTRVFFWFLLTLVLATSVALGVRRIWGRLPFAEYEAECGLTSGAVVRGRTYYDFSEDRPNPTRQQELRQKADGWESGSFRERVVALCRTNAVMNVLGKDKLERMISAVSVGIVPRQCSVIVRAKGSDPMATVELAAVYASEIETVSREADRDHALKVVEQLTRNLECQKAAVAKIEERIGVLKGDSAKGAEVGRLKSDLSSGESVCVELSRQLDVAKVSLGRGETGSFVRLTRRADEARLLVPTFWSLWVWLFPVSLAICMVCAAVDCRKKRLGS